MSNVVDGSIQLEKLGPDNTHVGIFRVAYCVLDYLSDDIADICEAEKKCQIVYLPPLNGTINIHLSIDFQGVPLSWHSHGNVIAELQKCLEEQSFFTQLKYTQKVTSDKEGLAILTIILSDALFEKQYMEDLTKSEVEQIKLNKLLFKTISNIDIKFELDYHTLEVNKRDIIDDLNVLCITLYGHLEKVFPILFRLQSRITCLNSLFMTPYLSKVFVKSDETAVMQRRELLFGNIKSVIRLPTIQEFIQQADSKKIKRCINNIPKCIENGELVNLKWF